MRSLVLAVTCALAVACAPARDAAQPSAGPRTPLSRFQRVDDRLYRGSQPDRAGFEYLRQLGIRTVINLRSESDARELDEPRIVRSLGMRYVQVPVKDGSFFTRSRTIPLDAIKAFFDAIDAPDAGPIFVHCRRGADRTGAMVGFYRIARHGWEGQRAYEEARAGGMRSWYVGLRSQIESFDRSTFPVRVAEDRR